MPSNSAIPDGRVSLVLAITGHRDLHPDDFVDLEAAVGEIFKKLRHNYRHTPLLLLSGLAEGADRIAVRAAIEASIPYVAILPMPEDLYRSDFKDWESVAEFEQLRNVADRRLVLPLAEGSLPDEVARPGPARDLQYERLGEFLVKYSQILIAIWDKKRTGLKGGTSEVVAMKLGERLVSTSRVGPTNAYGIGPVHEIFARRTDNGSEMPLAVKYEVARPAGATNEDYDGIYRLLDQYNADVAKNRKLRAAADKSRADLFRGAEATGLTAAMNWLLDVYAWSDVLAMRFRTRSFWLWIAVFVLLAIGGVALTWLHTMEGAWRTLFAYAASLIFALILHKCEVTLKWRNRHEDYRALAEALRVQFFWMVAGRPDLAAGNYPLRQAGEMTWIRDAMSECALYDNVLERSPGGESNAASRLDLAQRWVQGQADYFRETSTSYEKWSHRLHLAAMSLGVFGFLALSMGFLVPRCPEPEFKAWSHAVSGTAMWWAALAWAYVERRGFVQEARQYQRMYDLFHAADQDLRKFQQEGSKQGLQAAEGTILKLGQRALEENGDWLAMHRERKLTPSLWVG